MKGISSINQKTVLKYLDYMVVRRLEPATLDYKVGITPLWIVKRQQNIGTKENPGYECIEPLYYTIVAMMKRAAKKAGIKEWRDTKYP